VKDALLKLGMEEYVQSTEQQGSYAAVKGAPI